MFWQGNDLVAEDYLADKSSDTDEDNAVVIDLGALKLLGRFDEWVDLDEVATSFEGFDPDSVRTAIKQLVEAGLLRTRKEAERETRFEEEWRHWSTEARFFHFGTKDAAYIGDDQEHRRAAAEAALASGPPPAIFKTYPDAPRVFLPRGLTLPPASFGDVLLRRRTHRQFTTRPIELTALSAVLHYTFAPMHFVDAREYGTLMMRTSPAGGARHELECYVGALNVEGLQPGLYHYAARDHTLELVDAEFDRAVLDRLAFGQQMAVSAGFVCFLTAVFERATYKYRHPRTLRMILLDAGHLAQTFALTCTALGLGPFQTAAFRDSEVEQAIGLDGFAEGSLYLLGAGMPAGPVDGRPIDMTVAGVPTVETQPRP